MSPVREDLRNVAIIAHVDHGKTTLVDGLLRQAGAFRDNQHMETCVMDSNPLERERGITILAKNTSVHYKGVKLNIVDTPGHADFGGEVERTVGMADGVLLLVDAAEGPMPQTRFVLRKALALNLKPIVVINKIDRPDARVEEVHHEVLELFLELEASNEQLDFPVIYACGRDGVAKADMKDELKDLRPLFDCILKHIPAPQADVEKPFRMRVASLDYNDYVGRIAIGRALEGKMSAGTNVTVIGREGKRRKAKIERVDVYEGLKRVEAALGTAGDILCLIGLEEVDIGETIATDENAEPLPVLAVDEPTLAMDFCVNNSPLAGQEGTYLTSRHLRDRLMKEIKSNVALKVEETDAADRFRVAGRGVLHLGVLIENMRREGFELQVSKPEVILKRKQGELLEPIERLTVEVPDALAGRVMELVGPRRAEMISMTKRGNLTHLEYHIPARGLIGLRTKVMNVTHGEAVIAHNFESWAPFKGEIGHRNMGVLVSMATGNSITYGLEAVSERGPLFVGAGEKIYEGMIVGEHVKDNDVIVNPCKLRKLTNMRSVGADKASSIPPPRVFSLEDALEYIADDELVEVTPKTIRLRKKMLKFKERKRGGENSVEEEDEA